MKRTTVCLAFMLLSGGVSAEPAAMTGLDFMVDWPGLEGRKVIVTGGAVVSASAKFALLQVPGGNVTLTGPWADREDLRYLFKVCTSLLPDKSKCTMTVSGTVGKSFSGGPKLSGVDFDIPR